MYIANLTIETSEGTFEAGEEVKGLSSSDIARMTESGYITAVKPKAEKAEAPEEPEEEQESKKKKHSR